jgi:DNA-binding transcriptional ArsR family regulator
MQTIDPLSTTFSALADPTRRAILSRLATGEATVNELSAPFDVSLQAISRHLKVLERAGLITRGRQAQFRPCRLEAEPLDNAVAWIERHRQVWGERFDQLEQHLLALQADAGRADTPRPDRSPDRAGAPMTDPTTDKEQP